MPHCCVIIPTKNGLPLFTRVLTSVLRQETPWPFEVIVIDSGSRDGTLEFAEAQPGVRVLTIPPSEFGHGRSRNLAVAASSAPFIALLTHDAEPVGTKWLANLVAAVEQDEKVAGAFGRHVAHAGASVFAQRDLDAHFSGFLSHPLVVEKNTDLRKYDSDIGWRQFLHFFSDNNACLRRSVWEIFPYPDVDFAEDQIWAKKIIDEGYAKAYAPDAIVRHSHDYGIFERMQRSFDESRNFRIFFGYKLAPRLGRALRAATRMSRADFRYARTFGRAEVGYRAIFRQVLLNYSHVTGQYLGTHHRGLPAWLARRLSRDAKIFRQGQSQSER
jgi:rhamnosyltransferase